ncbi:hypothetical protein NDU88_003394 [Pleurodeles waltl]|uniref:Uncharacterized protein n=1 Tax=Pleurodeles waltl TaxID=8319 RepID=A0AAV7LIF9_PLEWA|nr:hypothetical protein NDU88_003394 [Pleurodeles waltl]
MAQVELRRFFRRNLTCPILRRPYAIFPLRRRCLVYVVFFHANHAAPVCLRRLTPFHKYGARMALQNGVRRRKNF